MLPNKTYGPKEFIEILRNRVLLLAIPPVVGVFVALVYSAQLPDVYQTETLIQIVPQRVPERMIPTTVTIRTEDRLDALTQQVQSRTQLERIIMELNLYPAARGRQPMQDIVEQMRDAMDIETIRPNRAEPVDAFRLKFKYQDPAVGARVTERLGALYVTYNAQERGQLAKGANEFLENQLAEKAVLLAAQEAKLQAFREKHAGRLPSQLQYNMQAIQSTQMQRQALVESLARDRDRKMMLERLYNDSLAEPAYVPPAASTPATPTAMASMPARQQLELARNTLAALENKLKEGHPDLRRARKQVADLEKEVAALPAAGAPTTPLGVTPEELQRRERLSSMRAEIESLDRQIKFKEGEDRRLGGVIADYQVRIEAVPGVESEWLALTRDLDTLQESYKDLLSKSEAARVSADLEDRQIGEQFRVLDPPRIPSRPVSPQRVLISAGGLAGGLVLGVLLIGVLELRDGSLKTDKDVEQVLDLPVVALVPALVTDQDRRRALLKRLMLSAAAAVAVIACGYTFWTMRLWTFVA